MTFIDAAAPIATHAALTTDVHGTGAGNDVVGNDEITQYSKITVGNYTGNNTANRAIPHGLGVVPSLVIITEVTNTTNMSVFRIHDGKVVGVSSGGNALYTPTTWDGTNFYVGNATNICNVTGDAHKFTAIE